MVSYNQEQMKGSVKSGFTLLEVLTATAILVMACALVLKISTQVLDTWGAASRGLSAEAEASLALDVMEEDIETAFPQFWVYKGVNDEGMDKSIRLCFYRQGRDAGCSALAYQVGYDKAKQRHGLYRYEMARKRDIKEMVGLGEQFSPQQMPSKKIISSSNLLAKDIANFSVKFLYKDDKGNAGWAFERPFSGLPTCAEILLTTNEGQQVVRRIPFVVNGRL